MEYHEALGRLDRLRRLRPKMGTETTAALLAAVGDPHEGVPAVQIAGSNGKGSTAAVLERILREAGLEVGLYTSPDLNDVRERIRVGGRKIPRRELVRFVEAAWPFVRERATEGEAPTFFEAFTALALWHFGREDVDVAVLEVGIGGRYDATSVVDPVAAAVTSVSLEHTDIIGSTVEEIARDKAQVAPADAPLVTGATGSALEAIREETTVRTVGTDGADVRVREAGMVGPTESSVEIDGPDWRISGPTPLLGAHQAINAGIAATLARQVADVSEAEVAAGIRNVVWPGRFEVMGREPLSILDGAHNPDACRRLATLLERFEYDRLHLVLGAMVEKDHREMCRALPAADRVYVVEPAVDRARDAETLGATVERERGGRVEVAGPVLSGVDRALSAADPDDCVLVAGSLYAVGEARDRWIRTPRIVRTDTRTRARATLESADVPAVERRRRADGLVGRTVRLRVRPGTADELRELAATAGGRCVVSGVRRADANVEVVLAGSIETFETLVDSLERSVGERRVVAEQLRTLLGLDAGGERADTAASGGSDPIGGAGGVGTGGAADEGGGGTEVAGAVDEAGSVGTGGGADGSPGTTYPWEEDTAVMGILNVTPDSFHDGGEYDRVADAVARAEEMVAAGAAVVDVGGESTRPGADPVPVEVECDRVVPVIEALADLDALVSIDTRKPAVAAAALDAGADVVNDVTGLADAEMRRLVADRGVPAVLMHSLSAPVDPEGGYEYDDVVDDVLEALSERILAAERAGIDRSQLLVDPGFGFGKTASESFALLDRLGEFRALGTPIMVGHSHKSMFAEVAGEERLHATVAATALAADRGADLIRVHDVAPNVDAVGTVLATDRSIHNTTE